MANLLLNLQHGLWIILVLLAATGLQAQEAPKLESDMPITIDAESSEFNYATSRLVFHGLRLDQGNLGIRADLAETDKLDFEEGAWSFSGNVIIEADTTQLNCEEASLSFLNHQLQEAVLRGEPARFEQPAPDSDKINSGGAREIIYDMNAGTLKLMGEAHFSDGVNEISGELITYDLTRGRLTAGSGDSGPVKILIEPPSRIEGEQQSP